MEGDKILTDSDLTKCLCYSGRNRNLSKTAVICDRLLQRGLHWCSHFCFKWIYLYDFMQTVYMNTQRRKFIVSLTSLIIKNINDLSVPD